MFFVTGIMNSLDDTRGQEVDPGPEQNRFPRGNNSDRIYSLRAPKIIIIIWIERTEGGGRRIGGNTVEAIYISCGAVAAVAMA